MPPAHSLPRRRKAVYAVRRRLPITASFTAHSSLWSNESQKKLVSYSSVELGFVYSASLPSATIRNARRKRSNACPRNLTARFLLVVLVALRSPPNLRNVPNRRPSHECRAFPVFLVCALFFGLPILERLLSANIDPSRHYAAKLESGPAWAAPA